MVVSSVPPQPLAAGIPCLGARQTKALGLVEGACQDHVGAAERHIEFGADRFVFAQLMTKGRQRREALGVVADTRLETIGINVDRPKVLVTIVIAAAECRNICGEQRATKQRW